MPRGAKPGERRGGRGKGVPNVRTQEIAAQAHKSGVTPLEVMIHNMRYFHESGCEIADRLKQLSASITAQDIVEGSDAVHQFFKLMDQLTHFREEAEKCAVDAAPYMHPKLAAITVKGDSESPVEFVHKLMNPKQAAEAYSGALNNG